MISYHQELHGSYPSIVSPPAMYWLLSFQTITASLPSPFPHISHFLQPDNVKFFSL